MKHLLTVIFCLAAAFHLSAQTNLAPVRLAIINESPETATAADMLTAEFSKNDRVQLLERVEIEKVYREQGLSAGNQDYLRLGRVLGADGLLLMETNHEGTNQFLDVRLVAVKPGVVLSAEKFSWPVADITEWSPVFTKGLGKLLPKLAVLKKDAIPVSVVNLRSAVGSAEAAETEQQLKLLTIQRLSQEQQIFLLERQKMELLNEEKELKADDSAFWSGAYLLEGTVDQNGYSPEVMTINARLTPPKGGTPVLIEVSGSRTNPVEIINRLATKVTAALSISPTVKEWNAADEAAQYFEEAMWAVKCRNTKEAQVAADSAWALGKRDLSCALVRIRMWVTETEDHAADYVPSGTIFPNEHYISGPLRGQNPLDASMRVDLREIYAACPWGIIFMVHQEGSTEVIDYALADKPPTTESIDMAQHALELYYEFSQNSPDGTPQVLSNGKGWNDGHDSDWYRLGLDDLTAASKILRGFCFVPNAQKGSVEKLAQLRQLTRSVAELISRSPTVHDSYFVGDRLIGMDELYRPMEEQPNIFKCELNWGCFWQDRPEETIDLYRNLMSSPVFCYIHEVFWSRDQAQPRLVAWNREDAGRIPALWDSFKNELETSTNLLLRIEAKGLARGEAVNDAQKKIRSDELSEIIRSNRAELVANKVNLSPLGWWVGSSGSEQIAMGRDWQKMVEAEDKKILYEKQKDYLKNNQPFDFNEFIRLFQSRGYSPEQAREILPLMAAYKSNLVVQAQSALAIDQKRLSNDIIAVGNLEQQIDHILHPPPPPPSLTNSTTVHHLPQRRFMPAPAEPAPEILTNILSVTNYVSVPLEQLDFKNIMQSFSLAQRWTEGKLVVALCVENTIYIQRIALGVFDPQTARWQMALCPYRDTTPDFDLKKSGFSFELFQGSLYYSNQKFDLKSREWTTLNIPSLVGSRLFAIEGRLYAANSESIFEITDGGKGTRVLAGVRRRPAVSALDSLDNLGSPQLFSGPNHTLCAGINGKIYSWDGKDWQQTLEVATTRAPEIFDDAVIFRYAGGHDGANQTLPPLLWIWDKHSPKAELTLRDTPRPKPGVWNSYIETGKGEQPLWKSPPGEYLTWSGAMFYKSNLYFFADHYSITNASGHVIVTEKDGMHAKLVCLTRDYPEPIVVPLKFDLQQGPPPLNNQGMESEMFIWSAPKTWMSVRGDNLYFGRPNAVGVWTIPISEIEAAIAARKNVMQANKMRAANQNNITNGKTP